MDQHNPPDQDPSSSAPPRRRLSYASVASGAAQPPPRTPSNVNDNAHTWIRPLIPGSSQQLPDPLRTNYLYYETNMSAIAESSNAAVSAASAAAANATTDTAGRQGQQAYQHGHQFRISPSSQRRHSTDNQHNNNNNNNNNNSHHHHHQPNLNTTSAAYPSTASHSQFHSASALPPPALRPPFPIYSRKFAEATDYKIAMTAGLPPNKNNFFFVPSYMKKSLYADQLREEQRAKLGYGCFLPRGPTAASPSPASAPAVGGSGSGSGSGAGGAAALAGGAGGVGVGSASAPQSSRGRGSSGSSTSSKSQTITPTRKLEQLSGDMPDSMTQNGDSMYAIVRVEPEVKYTIAPLPTRWVMDMEIKDFELVGDGLEMRFLAPDGRSQECCLFRTEHPMTHMCGVYYFEIEILLKTKDAVVCIGLSAADTPSTRLPGFDGDSLGYHSDDGRVNNGRQPNSGEQYGPKYGEGDVIGCGYDWKLDKVFFTKNGEFLGHAPDEINADIDLYPTVGMKKRPQVRISANFGQFPFKFDIDGYTAQQKRDALVAVEEFDLNGEEEKISKALVAQYLLHEGFTATAAAFEKDIREEAAARDGTTPPPPRPRPMPSDTRTRSTIRDLILRGHIDQAIVVINQHFPRAIDADLEFKIRCQKFIELIRRARVTYRRRQEQSSRDSRVSRPTSRMDVDIDPDNIGDTSIDMDVDMDDTHTSFSDAEDAELERALENPSAAGPSTRDENGNHVYTYSDAVLYGSKLEQLYSDMTSEENRERRERLDELFGLLAYPDARHSPNGYLLDERHLTSLADQISAACLKATGGGQFAALERLWQQTEVMLQDSQSYGGLGSVINLREDFLTH